MHSSCIAVLEMEPPLALPSQKQMTAQSQATGVCVLFGPQLQ